MVAIPCICPALPDGEPRHRDGDEVGLRERLDFLAVSTIKQNLGAMYLDDPAAGVPEVLGVLQEQYVIHGVESWTVVDERGKPVPATKSAIRDLLLTRFDAADIVAEAADELYREAVTLPLLRKALRSSLPGPTGGSTSVPTASPRRSSRQPKSSKRSSQSSISTIPTDDTETTGSHSDGEPRSSPSLVSVA